MLTEGKAPGPLYHKHQRGISLKPGPTAGPVMEGVGRCEEELVASLGGDKAGELREPGRGEGGYEVKAVIRTDF